MPSNDERRQVAARLRELIKQYGMPNGERFYELLDRTLDDPSGYHSYVSVTLYLADLIEPEERTCTFTDNWNDPDLPLPTCSACGWEAEETDCVCVIGGPMFQYDGKFCKECGAKVVEQ